MLKTTVFQSGRSTNVKFIMTLTWDVISSSLFLCIFVGTQSTTKAQKPKASLTGPQEFCHLETFNASCPHDTVIVMQSARYGRMKVGNCVKRNLGYVGCAVDVMRYMDAHCSGRSSCRVSIVDLAKTEMKPCPEDVTSYLEASYKCLPVQAGSTRHCSNHKQQRLPPTGGYLASALVTDRGFGSSRCPWIITVQPGQRINITLHNFARTTTIATSNTQGGGRRSDACYEFALVRESEGKKSIVGCVGDQRETAVYTSTTNSVQIYVLDRVISSQTVYFLLEYSVIGCSMVPQIKGAIVETKGTTATIKCNNTGEVWYLTCKGREWIGDFNNCSLSSQWTLGDIFEETDFPYGILIVVAIGVALGVFFGGLLLFTISMFLKRNHKKQGRNNRDNVYNEAMHDEHVMISEPDYNTGLIQKATDCPRTHVPVHCTETPTPVSTAMSLKRGTTTAQYGPDGLPPPPSFLLTTKSQGHHYESPTFT